MHLGKNKPEPGQYNWGNYESWHTLKDLGVAVNSKHENKSEQETQITKTNNKYLTNSFRNLLSFFEQLIPSRYHVFIHLLISGFCTLPWKIKCHYYKNICPQKALSWLIHKVFSGSSFVFCGLPQISAKWDT